MLLLLTLLLFFYNETEARDHDGATSPYVDSSMKEMQKARACLPAFVSTMMDACLVHLNVLEQHRFLTTVGLERILQQLEAGAPLCKAVKPALMRMLSRHENTVARRIARGESSVEGDGWDETTTELRGTLSQAEYLCNSQMGGEVRSEMLRCMRAVDKESTKKKLVHYFG
jgi:hypothetical protein